jgi:triacylglycerol lipase
MPAFQFEPHASSYSPINAYWLAQMSKLAYLANKPDIKRKVKKLGFDEFDYFKEDETLGFVAANDQTVIVSFRGTSNLTNWLSNINLPLTGGPLGKIHEGFALALNLVWRELRQMIADQQDSTDRTLWLTGHSLGGALATLTAARLLEKAQPVGGLYTYGSPRCGDETFADNFNSALERAYRVVNRNDLVTRMPPRELGYRHVGTVEYFDADCGLHGDLDGWSLFLRRVMVTLEEMRKQDFEDIKDHDLDHYLHCLEGNYPKDADAP